MKRVFTTTTIIAALGLVLGANWAAAQEGPGDDLDITMTLMPQGADLPDAVTKDLTLPPLPEASRNDADPRPGESSSAEGRAIAEQARAEGRAIGQAAAEAAQDNRENFGHGSPPENLGPPDNLPATPDNLPAPPDNLPAPPDSLPGPPDGVPGPPDGVPGPP